jgi:hypothetical protein
LKQVHFISYQYPDQVRVLIGSQVYTYRSSVFLCQRFMVALNFRGLGFQALNRFKKQADLIKKEEVHAG